MKRKFNISPLVDVFYRRICLRRIARPVYHHVKRWQCNLNCEGSDFSQPFTIFSYKIATVPHVLNKAFRSFRN